MLLTCLMKYQQTFNSDAYIPLSQHTNRCRMACQNLPFSYPIAGRAPLT